MLATAGRPPDDPRVWAVEMKYDGMRVIAHRHHGRWRLFSRTLAEVTGSFPELTDGLSALVHTDGMILDGEIVAPTPETGVPSFRRLQQRMGRTKPSLSIRATVPVQVFVFDVLHTGTESVTALPYRRRRAVLEDLSLSGPGVRTPPSWTAIPASQLLTVAADHHLEGIVSKRLDSIYRPGVRSRHWIKTVLRQHGEAIVVGWIPATGPAGRVGSLVLAAHDAEGALVLLGQVGTGFTDAARRALYDELTRIRSDRSPLRGGNVSRGQGGRVRWVAPTLVGSVQYREKQVVLHPMQHSTFRPTRGQCRLEDCSAFASQAGLIWQTAANQLRIIDASDTTDG